jgi:hypothetical protein
MRPPAWLPSLAALLTLAITSSPRAFARPTEGDLEIRADTVMSTSGDFGGGIVGPGATLTLDPSSSLTLTFRRNLRVEGSLVSQPAAGVRHVIRFEGVDEAAYVGGGMAPVETDVGLWVDGDGRLDLVGAAKTAWTRLAGAALRGDTTLTLAEAPAGWASGDTLVVAPTAPPTVAGFDTQFDEVAIASVDGRTVRLARPLAFDHPLAGGRWAAEVFVLDRNLVVEGTPGGRAHVWIRAGRPQRIEHVELRHLGPAKADDPDLSIVGRYPLHFHHSGDGSRGTVVEGVVVHHAGNRAFVAHASHGLTFRRTVSYDVTQTPYWWDPPVRLEGSHDVDHSNDSADVTYDHALAALVRASPAFRGYRLAGFQVNAGRALTLTRSVAVGVLGNKSSSGFQWPENEADQPWVFTDNLAHNNHRNGIFVWQNNPSPNRIRRFTAYHNGGAGIEHGAYANAYHYDDLTLFGNLEAGIHLHALGRDQAGGLQFQCVDVDGAGITRVGTTISPSPVDGDPARFRQVTMRNLAGAEFELSADAIRQGDTLASRVARSSATCADPEVPPGTPSPDAEGTTVWLPSLLHAGP